MRLADYGRFLRIAAQRRWDEGSIDLGVDARAWARLPDGDRRRLLRLLAGFCIGEAAVAGELEPFAGAAANPERAACFRAQAADEARHARFFDRVAAEVAAIPGRTAAERRHALRPVAGQAICTLFEERLPAAARRLAADRDRLGEATGLYHMLLEGVVFSAGQLAMREALADRELPGLRQGLELVIGDERWHLGFGARVLQDEDLGVGAAGELLHAGAEAVGSWGDGVPAAIGERIVALHRRRLRAAGLAPGRVAA